MKSTGSELKKVKPTFISDYLVLVPWSSDMLNNFFPVKSH